MEKIYLDICYSERLLVPDRITMAEIETQRGGMLVWMWPFILGDLKHANLPFYEHFKSYLLTIIVKIKKGYRGIRITVDEYIY